MILVMVRNPRLVKIRCLYHDSYAVFSNFMILGRDEMAVKLCCGVCKTTLYQETELVDPVNICEKYDYKCPKCGSPLGYYPEKEFAISAHMEEKKLGFLSKLR